MRATVLLTLLSSMTLMGLDAGCIVDPDDPAELGEPDDEASDGDAVEERVAPLPDGSPCPGGCNDPPPCHYGPGQCFADPGGGGSCWYPTAFDGSICDNGQACVVAECVSGSCVSYGFVYAGFPCDDGNPATLDDACDGAGTCEGTITCPGGCNAPPSCHSGPGQCMLDPATGLGSCWYPQAPSGSICEGPAQCWVSECQGGGCVPYAPMSAGASCNDGNFCTVNDQCDGAGNCHGTLTPCPKPKLPVE